MLCEKCGMKPAVMKIDLIVNNEKKAQYICEDCAEEMMGTYLSFDALNPFSLLSGFFNAFPVEKHTEVQCPVCGTTFRRFMDRGRFGCAHCYETFGGQLEPIFKKLHFSSEYKGKTPEDTHLKMRKEEDPVAKLERELKEAVAVEDYETAANLKKELERKRGDGGNE
ncbi:MAG TPA: UvrB/UvrC motif-containing protein [Clostridiales bacterium]|nr:UvrB/UvrC motif-containing protein [Clostridiales bacterium]